MDKITNEQNTCSIQKSFIKWAEISGDTITFYLTDSDQCDFTYSTDALAQAAFDTL